MASCRPRPILADPPMGELAAALVFLAIAALVAVAAVRLGMLVAPALDRLTHSDDEEERGRHD